jgi:hypothetical protein
MLKQMTLFVAFTVFAVTGCGQQQAAAPAPASVAAQPDQATDATPAPANVAPASPAQTTATTTPPPLPQIEPGVYRNGNFAVRVENAVLTKDNRYAYLTTTLSFHNTSAEPMSILLVRGQQMTIALDNGMVLGSGFTGSFTMGNCRQGDIAVCRGYPNEFTQIDPGSFASSSFSFRLDNLNAPAAQQTIPQVRAGTLNLRMLVIEGQTDRVVQVSLLNTPLTNNSR